MAADNSSGRCRSACVMASGRNARPKAAAAEALANRPLPLVACNQLRATIGEPLMTAAGYAAYTVRPPLDLEARQALLARLLNGSGSTGWAATDSWRVCSVAPLPNAP